MTELASAQSVSLTVTIGDTEVPVSSVSVSYGINQLNGAEISVSCGKGSANIGGTDNAGYNGYAALTTDEAEQTVTIDMKLQDIAAGSSAESSVRIFEGITVRPTYSRSFGALSFNYNAIGPSIAAELSRRCKLGPGINPLSDSSVYLSINTGSILSRKLTSSANKDILHSVSASGGNIWVGIVNWINSLINTTNLSSSLADEASTSDLKVSSDYGFVKIREGIYSEIASDGGSEQFLKMISSSIGTSVTAAEPATWWGALTELAGQLEFALIPLPLGIFARPVNAFKTDADVELSAADIISVLAPKQITPGEAPVSQVVVVDLTTSSFERAKSSTMLEAGKRVAAFPAEAGSGARVLATLPPLFSFVAESCVADQSGKTDKDGGTEANKGKVGEDAEANNKKQKAKLVTKNALCTAFAGAKFAALAFGGSSLTVGTYLRTDIAPGMTIKLSFPAPDGSSTSGNAVNSLVFYGIVMNVNIVIDGESKSTGTNLTISLVHSQAKHTEYAADLGTHPLYVAPAAKYAPRIK